MFDCFAQMSEIEIEMETKVSESRLWLAAVLKSTGEAMVVTDSHASILAMNPAAETTTGWAQEDVIGKPIAEVLQIVAEETLQPVESNVVRALEEGQTIHTPSGSLLIARDGTALPIDSNATLVRDGQGNVTGAILTFRGVAEPKRIVEALQEVFRKVQQAKREWESTVDELSDLILLIDSSGNVMRANRTVETWHLGQVTDVSGRPVHDLIHGNCMDPECYFVPVIDKVLRPATRDQPLELEIYDRVLGRHLLIKARSVRDPRRSAAYATVVVLQDTTERKLAEEMLRRYAAELKVRNEELDAFAHTVAHDLKNPIGLVMGYADLLLKDRAVALDHDLVESLQIVARIGRKMNNIVDELLLLAQVRNEEVQTEPLDMGSLVDQARQRLTHVIQESGAEIILPPAWPTASGYGPWIEEVWANYLSNALKYGGHPPCVELGAIGQPDGQVRFWVRDYGPGLTQEQQTRLFVPFTRLNRTCKGHGLGLSIVRRIIEKLGGQVGVESAGVPSQGSLFYFTLPAVSTHPRLQARGSEAL